MNKKFLLNAVKIVAFGVVPFMVENGKKALDKALEATEKVAKEDQYVKSDFNYFILRPTWVYRIHYY